MENIEPSLSPEKLLTLSQKYKWQLLFIGAGILLVFGGLIFSKIGNLSGDKVEVLGEQITSQNSEQSEIVVEISGSVENPGVYKLSFGSRVNDLLVSSGGLSENADRVWVDRNINKAAKLVDGQKIFIPKEGESATTPTSESSETIPNLGPININSSDQKTLESLSGIGPTYASKIIEHRPYSTIEELVSKKVIPQKTFDTIKDKISVY